MPAKNFSSIITTALVIALHHCEKPLCNNKPFVPKSGTHQLGTAPSVGALIIFNRCENPSFGNFIP